MSAPEIKHTPLPWIAELNEKSGTMSFLGERPDGNVRVSDGLGHLFHINLAARESADAVMFPEMSEVSKADAALVLTAVNSYHALQARVKELEEALLVIKDSVLEDTTAISDTLWVAERHSPNETVVDFIDAALQAKEG